MAKILYKSHINNITVKFLIKPKKYYLFNGNHQIVINNEHQKGGDSLEEAITLSKILFHDILNKKGKHYYSL